MGMVFEQLGLKYQAFDNGRLLLNYLDGLEDTSSVSMVFTDLEMPVASGHTVIKEIRQNKKTSALPIIVHTSMTSENNSREVLSMGADFFVGKVDTALIVETIKKVEAKYFL